MPTYLVPGLQQANLDWPDTTCQRAVEDRDLNSEAEDIDGCAGALIECVALLYPFTPREDGAIIHSRDN